MSEYKNPLVEDFEEKKKAEENKSDEDYDE